MPRLRGEVCACLAAVFCRILTGAGVAAAVAEQIAESTCREALTPDPPPLASIQKYTASVTPLRDLAHVAAAALGAPEDAGRFFLALSSYGSALRADLVMSAASVKRLLDAA